MVVARGMAYEPTARHFATPASTLARPSSGHAARRRTESCSESFSFCSESRWPARVGANEQNGELKLRLQAREKNWGSRESSWLVKNAFAGWRARLRCSVSVKTCPEPEVVADWRLVDELRRALLSKEAQLGELREQHEELKRRSWESCREAAFSSASGAVRGRARSEAALFLAWVLAAWQRGACEARLIARSKLHKEFQDSSESSLQQLAERHRQAEELLEKAELRASQSQRSVQDLEHELHQSRHELKELELRLSLSGNRHESLEERLRQAELGRHRAEDLLKNSEKRATDLELYLHTTNERLQAAQVEGASQALGRRRTVTSGVHRLQQISCAGDMHTVFAHWRLGLVMAGMEASRHVSHRRAESLGATAQLRLDARLKSKTFAGWCRHCMQARAAVRLIGSKLTGNFMLLLAAICSVWMELARTSARAKAEAASVAAALKGHSAHLRDRAASILNAFLLRGGTRSQLNSSFTAWSKVLQKRRQMQTAALALSRGCKRATMAAALAGWVETFRAQQKHEADSTALRQAAARFRSWATCTHETFDKAQTRYLLFVSFSSWLRNRLQCLIVELREKLIINESSATDALVAACLSIETKLARSIGAAGNLTVQGWSKGLCSDIVAAWRKACWQSQLAQSLFSQKSANEQLKRYRMTTREAICQTALKRHGQLWASRALLSWKQVCQLVRFQEHVGPALGSTEMQFYLSRVLQLWSRIMFFAKAELASRAFRERMLRNGSVAVAALEANNARAMLGTLLAVWHGLAEDRMREGMLSSFSKRLREKVLLCGRTLVDGQTSKDKKTIQLQRVFIDWSRYSQSNRQARRAAFVLIQSQGQALVAAIFFEWFRTARTQRHHIERNATCDDFRRKLYERGVRLTKWHCDREVESVVIQKCMRCWILLGQRARIALRAALAMQGTSPAEVAFIGWCRTARELHKVRAHKKENERKNRLQLCAAVALEQHCKTAFVGHLLTAWQQASVLERQQRCISAGLNRLLVRGAKFVEWRQSGAANVLRQQIFDRWRQQYLRHQAACKSALAVLAGGDRALTASVLAEWRFSSLSRISERAAARADATLHVKLHERETSMLAWHAAKGVRRYSLFQVLHAWCKAMHATMNARRLGVQRFRYNAHALKSRIIGCWQHLIALEHSTKQTLNKKHVFERLRASEIAGRLELRNLVRHLTLRILQSWRLAVTQKLMVSSTGLKSAAILQSTCSSWLLKNIVTAWCKLHEAASAARAAQRAGRNLAESVQLSIDRLAVFQFRKGPLRQLLMQVLFAWRHRSAVHYAAMAWAGRGGGFHTRALLVGAIAEWLCACHMSQAHRQFGHARKQLEERCQQRGSRLVSCYLLKGVSRRCLLQCLLAWSKLAEARRTCLRASAALISGKSWALRASAFACWARRRAAARLGQSWALSSEVRQGASLALSTLTHWRLAAEAGARHRSVAAVKKEFAGKFRQQEVSLAAWQSDRSLGKLLTSKAFSAWQARLRLGQAAMRSAGTLLRNVSQACLAACFHVWVRAALVWRTRQASEVQQASLRDQVHRRGDALAQWHCRSSLSRHLQTQVLDRWSKVVARQQMARQSGLALATRNEQTYVSSVFHNWCHASSILKVQRELQSQGRRLADEAWHHRSMGLIDFRGRHSSKHLCLQAFRVWTSHAKHARAEFVLQHRGARAAEMLAQGQHKVLLGLIVQGWSHLAISELHVQETAATTKCWADLLRRRCEVLLQRCSQSGQRKLLLQVLSCWSKRVKSVRFSRNIILCSSASKDSDLLAAIFSQLRRVCDLVRHQRAREDQREKLGALRQQEDELLIWHEQHGQARARLCQALARWLELAKSLRRARITALAAMDASNTFLLRISLSALLRSCSASQRERAKEAAEQLAAKVRSILSSWQNTRDDEHIKDGCQQVFDNWLKLAKSARQARKAALAMVDASDVSLLRICFSGLCRVCYAAQHQRALEQQRNKVKSRFGSWLNVRNKDRERESLHQVCASWSKLANFRSKARVTALAAMAANDCYLLRVIFSELCRVCRAARHQHALTAGDLHSARVRGQLMNCLSVRSKDRGKVWLNQAFASWLRWAQTLCHARRTALVELAANNTFLLAMILSELWKLCSASRHQRKMAAGDQQTAWIRNRFLCSLRARGNEKVKLLVFQAFASWLKLVRSLCRARTTAVALMSDCNSGLLRIIFSRLQRICHGVGYQRALAAADEKTAKVRNTVISWHSIRGQGKVLLVQTWAAWHAATLKIAEALRAGLFSERHGSLELLTAVLSGWRCWHMRERGERAAQSCADLRSQLQWNGTLALAARRVGEGEQVKAVLFARWAKQAARHSAMVRLDALRQDERDLPWLLCVLACWRSCGKEQRLLHKQQEMAALLAQAGAKLVEAGQREIKQGRAENKAAKSFHSVASDAARHSYAAASRAASRLIKRVLLTAWSRATGCKLTSPASSAVLFALRQETHEMKRMVWASWQTCKTLCRPRLVAARGTLSRAADKRAQAILHGIVRAWLMHVVGHTNSHQQAMYLSSRSDRRHARCLISLAFVTWTFLSVRAQSSSCSATPMQVSRAPRKSDSPIATESVRPLPPSILKEYGVVRSPQRVLQTSIVQRPVEAPAPLSAQVGASRKLPSNRIFHVNANVDAGVPNRPGVSVGRAASCQAPARSQPDGSSFVPRAASCHAPVSVPLIAPVYGRTREEPATVTAVTQVAAASVEADQYAATAIATALRDGMASVLSQPQTPAAVPAGERAATPPGRQSFKTVSTPVAGITSAPTPVRADAGLQPIRAPSIGFDAAAAMASWAGERRQGKARESSDVKHVGSATSAGLSQACPRCGNTYMWDAVFCRHCGLKRAGTPGSSLQCPAAQS